MVPTRACLPTSRKNARNDIGPNHSRLFSTWRGGGWGWGGRGAVGVWGAGMGIIACVRVRVRACVRACVRASACASACACCASVCSCAYQTHTCTSGCACVRCAERGHTRTRAQRQAAREPRRPKAVHQTHGRSRVTRGGQSRSTQKFNIKSRPQRHLRRRPSRERSTTHVGGPGRFVPRSGARAWPTALLPPGFSSSMPPLRVPPKRQHTTRTCAHEHKTHAHTHTRTHNTHTHTHTLPLSLSRTPT
jgi:hypothetical protein